MLKRDTSESLIKKDIGHFFYDINENQVRSRKHLGLVELAKLNLPRFQNVQEPLFSYDPLQAQKQLLKMKRDFSNLIPYSKQSERNFTYIPAVAEAAKLERIKIRI